MVDRGRQAVRFRLTTTAMRWALLAAIVLAALGDAAAQEPALRERPTARDRPAVQEQRATQARPDAFVDAATVVPGLMVDARYFGSHNFIGTPIDGYERPLCILSRPAAAALAQVARDLEPRGLVLKAFDCYRPARAVRHFVRWARNVADTAHKAEFYPEIDKRDLFRLGYIAAQSGHSRGSTIDLTLARASDGSVRVVARIMLRCAEPVKCGCNGTARGRGTRGIAVRPGEEEP
jgi:D-alanyl-D-alanine dipeptidase